MVFVLVDGDYFLTGFKTNAVEEVKHIIEHMEFELHRQLLYCNSTNGYSPQGTANSPTDYENIIQLRVILFSSALINSLSETQSQNLISTFRRFRYQTSILENSANRGGSPIDAALCTRAISFAMMPRFTAINTTVNSNNNNNNGAGGETQTFVFVTPNAYLSSALEFIISKHSCDVLFVVYDGDEVAEELLPYINPFYGKKRDGIAKIKKSIEGGTIFIPNTEAASQALAALQQEGKDLPLSVLTELKRMQGSLTNGRKNSAGGGSNSLLPPLKGDTADSVLDRLRRSDVEVIVPPPLPGVPNPFEKDSNNSGLPSTIDVDNSHTVSPPRPDNLFEDMPYVAGTGDHPGEVGVPPEIPPPPTLVRPTQLFPQDSKKPLDMDFTAFLEDTTVMPLITTELPSQHWKVYYDNSKNVKRLFYVYTDSKGNKKSTWCHPGGEEKQRIAETEVLTWMQRYFTSQVKGNNNNNNNNNNNSIITSSTRRKSDSLQPITTTIPSAHHNNNNNNNNNENDDLPAGWEERIDPRTGNKFYINHNTKETTWVCPNRQIRRTSLDSAPSIAASSLTSRNEETLPPGWEKKLDPATKRYFYINHQTKMTSWTSPNATADSEKKRNNSVTVNSPTHSSTAKEWEERVDPRTGKTFYVNFRTKETSWTKPTTTNNANAGGGATAPTPSIQSSSSTRPSVTSPWEAKVDPATGKVFYINHVTKRTSWTPPT